MLIPVTQFTREAATRKHQSDSLTHPRANIIAEWRRVINGYLTCLKEFPMVIDVSRTSQLLSR